MNPSPKPSTALRLIDPVSAPTSATANELFAMAKGAVELDVRDYAAALADLIERSALILANPIAHPGPVEEIRRASHFLAHHAKVLASVGGKR